MSRILSTTSCTADSNIAGFRVLYAANTSWRRIYKAASHSGSNKPAATHKREADMQMRERTGRLLLEKDVRSNPLEQFRLWLDEALAANLPQPLGMTLATASFGGKPSARMVLLRGFDERGFVFFTNYTSRKAN